MNIATVESIPESIRLVSMSKYESSDIGAVRNIRPFNQTQSPIATPRPLHKPRPHIKPPER